MEVGNLKGPNVYNESRTHFGLWCINSSPLVIGMDITDDSQLMPYWDILTNGMYDTFPPVRSLARSFISLCDSLTPLCPPACSFLLPLPSGPPDSLPIISAYSYLISDT